MSTADGYMAAFLKDLMRRRQRFPSRLAADLGISHATVIRWLSGESVPNTGSCQKLAEYSGASLQSVLAHAGHMPRMVTQAPTEWPEFREYARNKYPNELDDDLVTMIEGLIEQRRSRNCRK